MELTAAVVPWHEFYVAAASAAAVLLGLVFVGMSLHYDLRNLDRRLVAMATESAVPLFYAVLASLVMLVPAAQPWVPTGALIVVGLLAGLNAGVPLFGAWYSSTRRSDDGRRRAPRLRFVLPWVIALALVPAALGLLGAPAESLYAVGFIIVALIAFGMQNAWDVLLRRDLRGSVDRAPVEETT